MWRSRAWCRVYSEVESEESKGKGVCCAWRGCSNKYTLNLKLKPAFWLELKGMNKVHFFCSIPWTCTIPQPPEGSWQLRFHTADGRRAGQLWGQAWRHPHRFGHAAPESGPEAHGSPKKKQKEQTAGQPCRGWEQLHPCAFTESDSTYLIVEFLQKGNLFLQGFHFTLKVKPCQRSIVHILFQREKMGRGAC